MLPLSIFFLIILCLKSNSTIAHTHKSNAEYTGQRKIISDPCRWMACILDIMFYYPYHCPSLKIFMSDHKIRYPFWSMQPAASMLLTSSGRYCLAWLFYLKSNAFYWLGIYHIFILLSFSDIPQFHILKQFKLVALTSLYRILQNGFQPNTFSCLIVSDN